MVEKEKRKEKREIHLKRNDYNIHNELELMWNKKKIFFHQIFL